MSKDATYLIETRDLTKTLGSRTVLDRLSLAIPRGSMYGFLGPNGAGKTTTIRLLMGFIRPTAGHAWIDGHETWSDGVAARRSVGFLAPADALYPDSSGISQLDFAARLSGQPATLRAPILEALELSDADLNRRVGTYSKGMKQKLALVAAIQHDPDLLVLDEPTDGLDPLIRRQFEMFLIDLNRQGRTVFFSSHDLGEVERLCQIVAIIRDGQLMAQASISDLQQLGRRRVEASFPGGLPVEIALLPEVRVVEERRSGGVLLVEGDLGRLLPLLVRFGAKDLSITPPSLDEIFIDFYATPSPSPNGHHAADALSVAGPART